MRQVTFHKGTTQREGDAPFAGDGVPVREGEGGRVCSFNRVRRVAVGILVMPLVFMMMGAEAWAHSFYCTASVEGDSVRVYSWFGGRRATFPEDAAVRVMAPDGTRLHEGKTDANGEYAFPLTVRCDLQITVDSGAGHVAQTTVPADDLPASLPAWTPGYTVTTPDAFAVQTQESTPQRQDVGAGVGEGAGVDKAALDRVVRTAVQAQVEPLRRELRMYREARGWQDFLGGIGYILGLTGVAFYFLAHRKRKRIATTAGACVSPTPDTAPSRAPASLATSTGEDRPGGTSGGGSC